MWQARQSSTQHTNLSAISNHQLNSSTGQIVGGVSQYQMMRVQEAFDK
jgi:hypothetical protein